MKFFLLIVILPTFLLASKKPQSCNTPLLDVKKLFEVPKDVFYPQKKIENAIKLANTIGLHKAATKLKVPEDLLRFWLYVKSFSYDSSDAYSIELRTQVVQRSLRLSQIDAAEFFNVSAPTVSQFVKSYKIANNLAL